MKHRSFRYRRIFLFASLQFCGHIEEYFSRHTKHLFVYHILPRQNNGSNLIRIYEEGKMVSEKAVYSHENPFLYYGWWLITYWWYLFRFAHPREKTFVIGGHPILFFGKTIQSFIWRVEHVYWIGDYFPPVSSLLVWFEKLKKYYHDRMNYSLYLSNTINKIFNGTVVNTRNRKTVMWGLNKPHFTPQKPGKSFSLLFIGLIKPSQGLEQVFKQIQQMPHVKLTILGVCDAQLYKNYMHYIHELKIEKQILFPNTFVSQKEIENYARTSHAGLALYDIGKNTATYYTDPGKVKAYIELGLPIIMSDTSAIAPYIKKYTAGIVLSGTSSTLKNALALISKNYPAYIKGVNALANHFYYEHYYKKRFLFLS